MIRKQFAKEREEKKMKKLLALLLAAALLLPCAALGDTQGAVPCLPVPSVLDAAELADVHVSEDETEAYLFYAPASKGDLDYYLTVCAVLGTYAKPMDDSGKEYRLFVPGSAYAGFVSFDPEQKYILVYTTLDASIFGDEALEDMLGIFSCEVRLPADAGSANVFPQFYACVEKQPYFQTTIEGSSSIFNGQKCWTEMYDGMTNDKIDWYTTIMLLFGFDVRADYIQGSVEEGVTTCVLHYSNGDAEVIVVYTPAQGNAQVSYKPGVSVYLLGVKELNEAIQ